jgi:ABC-type transport system involved in cytochrome bd biosynthesis fused ATPase/permease subunit
LWVINVSATSPRQRITELVRARPIQIGWRGRILSAGDQKRVALPRCLAGKEHALT